MVYRSHNKNVISIYDPTRPAIRAQTILATSFWRLIACHALTHAPFPLPPEAYSQRAKDIFDGIAGVPFDPNGTDSLSWACPMNLLRIIVDEAAVTTELFCSLLNACPIIPKHRTAPWGRLPDGTADQNAPPNPNNPFAQRGGLMEDGLAANAYIGSVYANPPYNGTAIDESIAQAILATRRGGFRATYVVPMTEAKIAAFDARVIPEERHECLLNSPQTRCLSSRRPIGEE